MHWDAVTDLGLQPSLPSRVETVLMRENVCFSCSLGLACCHRSTSAFIYVWKRGVLGCAHMERMFMHRIYSCRMWHLWVAFRAASDFEAPVLQEARPCLRVWYKVYAGEPPCYWRLSENYYSVLQADCCLE
jgi:hypothetical protein